MDAFAYQLKGPNTQNPVHGKCAINDTAVAAKGNVVHEPQASTIYKSSNKNGNLRYKSDEACQRTCSRIRRDKSDRSSTSDSVA